MKDQGIYLHGGTMKTQTQRYRWCRVAGSLILFVFLAGAGSAAETAVHGRVT